VTTDIRHLARPGRTYLNVPLCTGEAGRWPDGTEQHYIEAANLPCHPNPGIVDYGTDRNPEEFAAALADGAAVTLIGNGDKELLGEKEVANRPLFGLLLGAGDLLGRSHPGHGLVRWVALVKRAEPNMSWVFKQAGISIELAGPPN
jgi:hypothetical protein